MSMQIGDKVILTEDAIENYGEDYRNVELVVEYVSRSTAEHPGYDGQDREPLYDFEDFPNSLYTWEIIRI